VSFEIVDPGEELEQGDVVLEAPSVYVRSLAYLIDLGGNRFKLDRRPPTGGRLQRQEHVNVREAAVTDTEEDPLGTAAGGRRPGMIISHGCEIDKESANATVLVAQVRLLADVHEDDRPAIVSYANKRTFYLPPSRQLEGERYVDLRLITTVRQALFHEGDLQRAAALDVDGQRALQAQLFRFFARKRLIDDWATWPDEHEERGGGTGG
jgi:hypothetical protein